MATPNVLEKLTPDERNLIESYRRTRPAKRADVLTLAQQYRNVFPVEVPRLRLVAPK